MESFPLTGMETRNENPARTIIKKLLESFPLTGMETFDPPKLTYHRDSFGIFSPHGDGCDYRLHEESEYLRNTPGKCLKTSTRPL